jgi:hypothetical protein
MYLIHKPGEAHEGAATRATRAATMGPTMARVTTTTSATERGDRYKWGHGYMTSRWREGGRTKADGMGPYTQPWREQHQHQWQ